MVFHWSLSDRMPPQVSRTLLSILADLSYAVVWMVSTRTLISNFSILCTNHLVTVPRVPIIIGIVAILMFHSFFSSLARSRYLSFFSLFSIFICGQPVQQSPLLGKFSFSCWLLLGLVTCSRLGDLFVSQNPRGVCSSRSQEQTLRCAYTICLYGQTSTSCTIPSELTYPLSCV